MTMYANTYICEDCGEEWVDLWDCMCNDRCPKCDKETEPTDSLLLQDTEEDD